MIQRWPNANLVDKDKSFLELVGVRCDKLNEERIFTKASEYATQVKQWQEKWPPGKEFSKEQWQTTPSACQALHDLVYCLKQLAGISNDDNKPKAPLKEQQLDLIRQWLNTPNDSLSGRPPLRVLELEADVYVIVEALENSLLGVPT